MASRPQVLICGTIVWAQKEVEDLNRQGMDVLRLDAIDRSTFIHHCASGGKYGEVVAIYRHNTSADLIGVFDKELVEELPTSLKFICHNGAGYDQIDIDACTSRGIQVSNTPSAVDDATATTAIFLIISALRGYWKAEKNARLGKFKEGLKPGSDPEGKILGIIGMGGIGRALAHRALGFSMKIQYHNRQPLSSSALSSFPAGAVKYVPTLDLLLSTSDVISLNLPLNDSTKGFMDASMITKMKDGVVIINTARGGVIDEKALIDALKSGKVSTAGLDVFPDEPHINPELLENDRITILPHMGTETRETQHKMEVRAIDNIRHALKSGEVVDVVVEQKQKS